MGSSLKEVIADALDAWNKGFTSSVEVARFMDRMLGHTQGRSVLNQIVQDEKRLDGCFERGRIEGLREALGEAEEAKRSVYAGLKAEQDACAYVAECIRADMAGLKDPAGKLGVEDIR